jgi:beta-glucanase (GH16 family)
LDGGSPDAHPDSAASNTGGGNAGDGGPEQCVNRSPVAARWTLLWSDEFDVDGAPNPTNWGFESGFVRNEELQWYEPGNATVADGLLTIAAQRQQVANPNYVAGSTDWTTSRQYAEYTSSSMTTAGKHSFQYGRFEMCGQIDTRLGSWPAFWILGDGLSWPSSGEVDIMEYYASGVRANVCIPSAGNCDWTGSVSQPLSSLAASWPAQFHLWAMEWNATDIDLYLDDELVYDFKVSRVTTGTNPYTGNPFYMIVNLAIGSNGGDPTNTTFPMTYKVDYVRVYQ